MKSFSSWEGWKGKKCNLSSYLLLLCVEMIFITMLLQSTLSFSDGWNKKKDENTNAATCNFLDRKCKNGSHDLISQLFLLSRFRASSSPNYFRTSRSVSPSPCLFRPSYHRSI